jgi:hypothetical protein
MKTASLLALALGLAGITPAFAHADYRPHQPVHARAVLDQNHDGHISGREVRRENAIVRQREMERREAARLRYVARVRAERRAFWDAVRYPYRYR